jgi:AcrR family transcriptional regulator
MMRSTLSVDWKCATAKNIAADGCVTGQNVAFVRFAQRGAIVADRHVKDTRVRRTQRRLRDAIVSLIHEKSYPAIAVNEILERADVGRSAFYAHFPNKDALLASGIEQMLHATAPRALPRSVGRFGTALRFSFPVFEYIGQCRHTADAKMSRSGRHIVHQHLHRVLAGHIRDEMGEVIRRADRRIAVSADLATEYIVTTFILVLNWWVDSRSDLSAREVDDLFLALVVPALTSACGRAGDR